MYLDPGLGSMLIQVGVAIVAVIGVALSIFRTKIKAIFSRNRDRFEDDDE